jgi:hypothetical protein
MTAAVSIPCCPIHRHRHPSAQVVDVTNVEYWLALILGLSVIAAMVLLWVL